MGIVGGGEVGIEGGGEVGIVGGGEVGIVGGGEGEGDCVVGEGGVIRVCVGG